MVRLTVYILTNEDSHSLDYDTFFKVRNHREFNFIIFQKAVQIIRDATPSIVFCVCFQYIPVGSLEETNNFPKHFYFGTSHKAVKFWTIIMAANQIFLEKSSYNTR